MAITVRRAEWILEEDQSDNAPSLLAGKAWTSKSYIFVHVCTCINSMREYRYYGIGNKMMKSQSVSPKCLKTKKKSSNLPLTENLQVPDSKILRSQILIDSSDVHYHLFYKYNRFILRISNRIACRNSTFIIYWYIDYNIPLIIIYERVPIYHIYICFQKWYSQLLCSTLAHVTNWITSYCRLFQL